MSAEPPRRDWHTPPRRHPGLEPRQQRPDSPAGTLAVICFLLLVVLLAIVLPEWR